MNIFKGLLVLIVAVFGQASPAIATVGFAPVVRELASQHECESWIGILTGNPGLTADLLEKLFTPTPETPAEVYEEAKFYDSLHVCLLRELDGYTHTPAMLTALERIRDLSKYYPIFIAGYETREGESILKEIDPARDQDPALVRLREEAGVPPPPGRFFVRFYRTREAIPPGIEHLFRDENVAGVTFFPRYIAVPALDPEAWQESLERSKTIQETISHELVHAYVNCVAGYRVADLPTWYLEGVAIYFSNSSGSRIVVTSQGDLRVSPTEEYETYGLVFKYLEDRLGRSAFLSQIRRSLETVDAALLYRESGFSSYEELADSALLWEGQQSRQPLLYALAILAGIAVLGAAFYYVPRLFVDQRTSHESVIEKNLDTDER